MTMRHLCHTAVCSAVCLLILLLAGCTAGTDRDLLWYQDGMSAAILIPVVFIIVFALLFLPCRGQSL